MRVPVYKVLLVGDANVGKSSMIRRLLLDEFDPDYKATVGVDLSAAALNLGPDRPVILTLIDLGGQSDFTALRTQYYKGAHAAVFVFDVSDRTTFDDLAFWYEGVRSNVFPAAGGEPLLLVVGNKSDVRESREVSSEEGAGFARQIGVSYIETSAKTGHNITELFEMVAEQAYERYPPRPPVKEVGDV